MAARSSLEAARLQAAARGGAAAAAAMSSRLLSFLPRPLRTAPAGISLRRAFNFLSSSRGAAAAAEQSTMESEQPSFQWMMQLPRSAATTGHSPAASASQSRRARMTFTFVASEGHGLPLEVCMCCCSVRGRRKPRVASAVTQSGPVPRRSRCARAVDGPFESGGAGVEWRRVASQHAGILLLERVCPVQ